MPKVSAIIPNYNHSRFLSQRINSVLNQTYQDFEIIILDDHSTDHSKDVIEIYRSHPKVTSILYNESNSGSTFRQWKKGLPLAEGKYIWIAESDDYADEFFLEKLVKVLDKHENIGLIYCNSLVVDENNTSIDDVQKWYSFVHEPGKVLDSSTVLAGREFCMDTLVYVNVIPNASAVLFRKDLILNNLSWIDDKLRNSGDWKLWINILLNHDFGYVHENLNYFRKHSNNVTNSILKLKLEALIILKEIIKQTSNSKDLFKLYDSLFIWAFNPVFWGRKFTLNHSNIRYYFRNNISLKSVYYFVRFTFKNVFNK